MQAAGWLLPTYRADAQPIVPIEWVQAASEDIIETVVHLGPPVVPLQDQTPGTRIVASKALRAISGVKGASVARADE